MEEAIKPYAFRTSPYPVSLIIETSRVFLTVQVILTLENHLSRKQEDVMVQMMKDIFGGLLFTGEVGVQLVGNENVC